MRGRIETQAIAQIAPYSPAKATDPGWSPARRMAFRFGFVYWGLYILPFPIGGLLPYTDSLATKYSHLWDVIIPWIGLHLIHLRQPILTAQTGSGDRVYDWVQTLCFLVLAAVAAVVWSIFDSERREYVELYHWLHLFLRLWLAMTMIGYGAVKVIPVQMPSPSLQRLIEPFGDSSPMGLLWSFVGASKAYSVAVGSAEMLGGVLLFVPRTTALGALVCIIDLTQVFLLNMCYDTPVKLFSFQLLIIAVFLISPDLRALTNFFLFGRAAEPSTDPPLFRRTWLNRTVLVLQIVIGTYLVGMSLYDSLQVYKTYTVRSPLYGIWSVDEFIQDGQVRPPLLTDEVRWQRVLFEQPDSFVVQHMNGEFHYYKLDLNLKNKTAVLGRYNDSKWSANFSVTQSDASRAVLDGELDGRHISIKAHRVDEPKFPLLSRGFHWIAEFPFNR